MERAGPCRPARFVLFAAALAAAVPIASPVSAAPAVQAGQSIDDFYAARGGEPLWLEQGDDAPVLLLGLLQSAEADGLDPARYDIRAIQRALGAAWGGDRRSVDRADRLLSRAFVAYVRDLKNAPDAGMDWVDADLRPTPPSPRAALEAAARANDRADYVARMRWMNPIYADLRDALVRGEAGDARQEATLRLNLARARVLPGPSGRYIIVNAGAQRLSMVEDGRVVDTMRVVVGKPIYPTPMMAAKVRFASLNPYWHVPPDLTAERIAPGAVKGGARYLKAHGYEVMSTWDDSAEVVDPATIDWQAVADGKQEIRVRQRPGPGNSMGQMKFMFPNRYGVYLHDTPQKELLTEASRMFSGGCVRLEDAARLGRWLFGHELKAQGAQPEQRVDLDRPVPVYITYLTAAPSEDGIAFYDDVYGRDGPALAGAGVDPLAPIAASR